MRTVFFIMAILYGMEILNAQDIEVQKFEPIEKDQTAALSPRKDINGTVCGLVKVALKEPGAEFEGNVMGDVQFTGSEYLVYLPNGTKRLGIKHPDYLPTTIVFADYGTKKIASSTTYELKVKTNKKQTKVDNSKKGMAVFNIKPSNAMLLIDGQIADGSGGVYTLSLPYGTHYYTVKLKDFSINNQSVQIDKNAKNINVDLTEFFAKVDVSCKTGDASILVNNEQKGFGKWRGIIIPGKCTIEAKKDGYHSLSKSFDLMDGDSVNVDFNALKAITGSLRVENELKDCEVFLNGKKVGTTPWVNKNLPIGEYNVEIRHENYKPLKLTLTINEDQEVILNKKLEPTQFGRLLIYAEQGVYKANRMMADLYKYGIDGVVKEKEEYHETSWNNDYDDYYYKWRIEIEDLQKEMIVITQDVTKENYWAKRALKAYEDYSLKEPNAWDDVQCSWLQRESYDLMINYLLGDDVKIDYKESFFWANIASKYGFWRDGIAYAWLAWHYYHGRGVNKDKNKALEYLNKRLEYDKKKSNECSSDILKKVIIGEHPEGEDKRILKLLNND